jgi:hypothetical protein
MRHLIVAAGMFFLAVVATFSTASFLQVIAQAQHARFVETVVVESNKPSPVKQVGAKERTVSVRDAAVRSASSL